MQGDYLVRYLARSKRFAGIGEATAHRLWETYGPDLYAILAGSDPGRLHAVLENDTATSLLAAWQEDQAESDVAVWLDEHRFDPALAGKVIRVWGKQGVEKLRANPYVMLTFAAWKPVDAAALAIGVPSDDPRRMIGAVEGALYARLERKHTATSRTHLVSAVNGLLRCGKALAERAVDLAGADGAAAPVPGTDLLQPAGAAVMERYVEDRLGDMLASTPRADLFSLAGGGGEVHCLLDEFDAARSHRLTDEQRKAVSLALASPVGVLTGGAGVGKTSVLAAVHTVCRSRGVPVMQMALAGRAAQRLKHATGEKAYTIAGFLLQVATGRLRLPGGTLIIVDEASMVDLPSAYRLLRAIPPDARLLLVGDPAQLPPIGFGLVFHLLARSDAVPRVQLTRVHRQAESTGIPAVAAEVRRGHMPDLPRFAGRAASGVTVLPSYLGTVGGSLEDVMAALLGHGQVQIITPLRQGPGGVDGINSRFHSLRSAGKRLLRGKRIAVDDPVVWTVNDWERGLMNGSLGTIAEIDRHGTATVLFDAIPHVLEAGHDQLPLELAYAITVHRAQGSQFDRVVVPLFASRILDRALVYTAITRGVEQVVLVGDMDAAERAIVGQDETDLRLVGLDIRDRSGQYPKQA